MRKKSILLLLIIALFMGLQVPVMAADYSFITSASKVSGSSYTDIPKLASALDKVFSGNIKLYSDSRCQSTVSVPLGSSKVPVGTSYYVREDSSGKIFSGSSCYIYANAVYSTLFGDIPYHGYSASWKNSKNVASNLSSASYGTFSGLGIKTGALLRTTGNKDGSYNGNSGHSIIILSYDKNTVTYLDGNGNGKGLVRVNTRTWSNFNSSLLTRRGYKISFIVQPTESYYASLSGQQSGSSGGTTQKPSNFAGYFTKERSYDGRFTDIITRDWFYSAVVTSFELKLMKGTSGGTFSPDTNITLAEAAALSARMLSGYWDDKHDFTPKSGESWYQPYIDYCAVWGIDIYKYGSPEATIDRGRFAALMARSLPDAALESIKTVPDGYFSDVPYGYGYYNEIYKLSRAGILIGTNGNMYPDSTITRAEIATIIARMADYSQRMA